MAEIVHTANCLKTTAEMLAWKALWPNACGTCEGWGSIYFGSDEETPGGDEGCEKCLMLGICPRCATRIHDADADIEDESEIVCPSCNWTVSTQGMPEAECWCGEDQMFAELDAEEERRRRFGTEPGREMTSEDFARADFEYDSQRERSRR